MKTRVNNNKRDYTAILAGKRCHKVCLDMWNVENVIRIFARVVKRRQGKNECLCRLFVGNVDVLAESAIRVAVAEGSIIGTALTNVLKVTRDAQLCCHLINCLPRRSVALAELEFEAKRQLLTTLETPAHTSRAKKTQLIIIGTVIGQAHLHGNIESLIRRCRVELLYDLAKADATASRPEDALCRCRDALKHSWQLRNRGYKVRDLQLRLIFLSIRLLIGLRRYEEVPPLEDTMWRLFRKYNWANQPEHRTLQNGNILRGFSECLLILRDCKHASPVALAACRVYDRLPAPVRSRLCLEHAHSLLSAANALTAEGCPRHAVALAKEGICLYRRLANECPDAHQPVLAAGLRSLMAAHRELGAWQDALGCAREMSQIYGDLYRFRPSSYGWQLIESLKDLVVCLIAVNHDKEASDTYHHALNIWTELGGGTALIDGWPFVTGFFVLPKQIRKILSNRRYAMGIRQKVASRQSEAFKTKNGKVLTDQALTSAYLGEKAEAVKWAQAATEICRRLSSSKSDASQVDLCLSLFNLASRLLEAGKRNEARPPTVEVNRILNKLRLRRSDALRNRLPEIQSLLSFTG